MGGGMGRRERRSYVLGLAAGLGVCWTGGPFAFLLVLVCRRMGSESVRLCLRELIPLTPIRTPSAIPGLTGIFLERAMLVQAARPKNSAKNASVKVGQARKTDLGARDASCLVYRA